MNFPQDPNNPHRVPGSGGAGESPGAYAGPGAPRALRCPIEVKRSGVVQERSSLVVLLLSFLTCGIYYLYWIYRTDSELVAALDDSQIKPGVDVLLTILTCGIWSVYVEFRNAQKVHAALLSRDPQAKDQSETILILDLVAFVVGATWLVATYLLQEELNKLARY